MPLRLLVTVVVLAVMIGETGHACSTFCIDLGGKRLFGRNYDFEIGGGFIMSNPAGLRKRGAQPGGPEWTSRFGSVTFNQFGRDNPMGGMNTAGLVVELMWLNEAAYPGADGRSPLGVLEWIQYQLDTAESVADVLKNEAVVRIEGQVPLHYLISDPAGTVAVVEYLEGKLVTHTGATLPFPVLTNSPYRESAAFTAARAGDPVRGSGSLERFARAASSLSTLQKNTPTDPIAAAFSVLHSVAQGNTRWTIVYDQSEAQIHFRTATHPMVRTVTLSRLDFACQAGVRMLDLDQKVAGDITGTMARYSSTLHLEMLRKNYAASSVTRRTPPEQVAEIATRPEKSACAAGS
jgi:penicillin V acylase-like amidase (Ntn superfamily)